MGKYINYIEFVCLAMLISCNGTVKKNWPKDSTAVSIDTAAPESLPSPEYTDPFEELNLDIQLMQVLRRVFQDSRGNLWFVGDGVFCYDGDSLIDLSDHEAFRRTVIRQIVEDPKGNIWLGTHMGIIQFAPKPGATGWLGNLYPIWRRRGPDSS